MREKRCVSYLFLLGHVCESRRALPTARAGAAATHGRVRAGVTLFVHIKHHRAVSSVDTRLSLWIRMNDGLLVNNSSNW